MTQPKSNDKPGGRCSDDNNPAGLRDQKTATAAQLANVMSMLHPYIVVMNVCTTN